MKDVLMDDHDNHGEGELAVFVRVSGCGDELFEVMGNPHTFRGLVTVRGLSDGIPMSVRVDRIRTEGSPYIQGWIDGYSKGSEPPPVSSDFPARTRRQHELDYYYSEHMELPVERAGRYSFEFKWLPGWSDYTGDVYARVAAVLSGLADANSWWRDVRWTPITEHAAAPLPLELHTPDQIRAAFAWLNSPYELNSLVCSDARIRLGNSGTLDGSVELLVEIGIDETPDRAECSIFVNVEDPNVFGSRSLPGEGEVAEFLRTTLFAGISEARDIDCASVSFGSALRNSILIPMTDGYGDQCSFAMPGWSLYLSERAGRLDDMDNLSPDYRASPLHNGTLFEFRRKIDEFEVDAANALSAALSESKEGDC